MVRRCFRRPFVLGFTSLCLWSGPAQAEVDWCRFLRSLPGPGNSFEQIASQVTASGCEVEQRNSAHSQSWTCTDASPRDSRVLLFRQAQGYPQFTALIISSPRLTSLAHLQQCPTVEATRSRWSMTAPALPVDGFRRRPDEAIGRDGASGSAAVFEPGSIVLRERLPVRINYSTTNLYLLGFDSAAYVVAASPEGFGSTTAIAEIERGLFGIRRESYPTTVVEIAGKNLISTPTEEIVAALLSRGATQIGREDGSISTKVRMSPPVGLTGVDRVTVESIGRHAWEVEYRLAGADDYTRFVALLDGRYGRSSQRASTVQARRACRLRGWSAGKVEIIGETCPDSQPTIRFVNFVQIRQFRGQRPDRGDRRVSPQKPTTRDAADRPRQFLMPTFGGGVLRRSASGGRQILGRR